MNTLCFGGISALLCLIFMISFVSAEGDNRNNEYLRFGRESNNGYIRFGRNDPFLRFGKRNDPFLRFGKQDPFLRFGRQDPFLRFGREDPFLRFGRNDPYLRFGRNDPYLRFGRNDPYLRFGKNDPFLRFGKSAESDVEADVDAVTLSREHGFLEENDINDRRRRSTDGEGEQAGKPSIRQARDADSKTNEVLGNRDVRNGPYMRFGKKSDPDFDGSITDYEGNFLEDEYSRIGRPYGNKLSLPRFGKRRAQNSERKHDYMVFGRAI